MHRSFETRLGFGFADAARGAVGPGEAKEDGSALLEFLFLMLLLAIPLVYFILTMGALQRASYAAVGAADQAAKLLVSSASENAGRDQVERLVEIVADDLGLPRSAVQVRVDCGGRDCSGPGNPVTATVVVEVPLPVLPVSGPFSAKATAVDASATQLVGAFR